LKVLPAPIPFDLNISLLQGSGYEDSANQRNASLSLDARGVREFASGDQIRHVHGPSTARSNRLMVRDFESQAGSRATVLVQRAVGTDLGERHSSLDQMCGHAAYLIEQLLPRCSHVGINADLAFQSRTTPLLPYLEALAELRADGPSLANDLQHALAEPSGAGQIYLFMTVADPEILNVIRSAPQGSVQAYVYSAKDFSRAFRGSSAGEGDFIQALERAGARVQLLDSGVSA
jgi:uncharacterized protein (DUF58 family)